MRYIAKGPEPASLTTWKAHANADWQPSYKNLGNPQKSEVLQALLTEQGNLCCYCEGEIETSTSHIEHLRPQSDPAVDALDFTNMLGCCKASRHCGAAKGNWWEREMVSPLEPSCEQRLKYSGDGRVSPERPEDGAADRTIARLGLDAPELRALRRATIDTLLAENCSADEFKVLLLRHLQPDECGRLRHFHSAVRQVFGVSASWLRGMEAR
jgi:uncharacterized protein (TIGR02646 family)